jgi:tetratricopeptide (TPR) repeat protein
MSFKLGHSGKPLGFAGLLVGGIAAYLLLICAQFLAAEFADRSSPQAMRWAIRLDPRNAEYRDEMGQLQLRARQSPQDALEWSQSATVLNPNRGRYWLHRAWVEQSLAAYRAERESLAHATASEPHSSELAWDAANLYLLEGDTESALREYRRVIENDIPRRLEALEVCWRIDPDAGSLLQKVVPAVADPAFLSFLVSRDEPIPAAEVWERMVESQQPVERPLLFEYLRFLFRKHDAVQAARAWQQSANLAGLSAYQPRAENLIVNGDFSLEILNGGFDWQYRRTPGVTLALDPTEARSGSKSVRISFDGSGVADAGLRQFVSVRPGTQYQFSAYYKTEEIDGAGGARFALADPYTATTLLMSDDLRHDRSWTQVNGSFVTGPDAHLVVFEILRVPEGSPIRGKLWIDDLKLVAADPLASLIKEQP